MHLLLLISIIFPGLVIAALFLPFSGASRYKIKFPVSRFHEADAVLSRRRLVPDSEEYISYYNTHPRFMDPDDRAREAPGLLSPESKYFEPSTFAAADANFSLTEHLGDLFHGEPSELATVINSKRISQFLISWLKRTGAHRVGITRLKSYHLYSHKGRGPRNGQPIPHHHEYAIAITVEMDHRMMQSAPAGPTVMESSEQYLNSGILALKTAAYIRNLGYSATAHIDGNYEVICPLVAADAGLGVIGRMGLLITPRLGPRVRIAVVTTNLQMELSRVKPDSTVIDFCMRCKKCSDVCPANAIPDGNMESVDEIGRWRINSEKCYHYWTVSGTDCGRCIISCPYGHPDNIFHRFFRWGIKNNLLFRQLAVKLDNIFYGRKPKIRSLPDWVNVTDDQ